jgi:hypothetical protein
VIREPRLSYIFWGIRHALHASSHYYVVRAKLYTLCRNHDSFKITLWKREGKIENIKTKFDEYTHEQIFVVGF